MVILSSMHKRATHGNETLLFKREFTVLSLQQTYSQMSATESMLVCVVVVVFFFFCFLFFFLACKITVSLSGRYQCIIK